MQTSSGVSASKSRLTKAVSTRRKVDIDRITSRGKEVLKFLKHNAQSDLETVERAVFHKCGLEHKLGAAADKIESWDVIDSPTSSSAEANQK